MKKTKVCNVYKKDKQIFTKNYKKAVGKKVYNEKIIKKDNREFRSWNPYRSKLAAALLNGLKIDFKKNFKILYLGASTGTTVSHVSDIVEDGLVYAVEISAVAMKKLIRISEYRENIVPILGDANSIDSYTHIVSNVDFLYQDVSQRNQAEIFVKNANRFLKKDGKGLLMVKSRSIDVSLEPEVAFNSAVDLLEDNGFEIIDFFDLTPYHKDHAGVFVSFLK